MSHNNLFSRESSSKHVNINVDVWYFDQTPQRCLFLTWSMKKRRESGKPSIIPASTLGKKFLQKNIDICHIGSCKKGWYRSLWHQIRYDNIHFQLKENSRQLGRSFPTQEGGTLHAPGCYFFSAFKVRSQANNIFKTKVYLMRKSEAKQYPVFCVCKIFCSSI